MYAIIVTGGKQYRVEQGDIVYIEKLDVEADSEVKFDQVDSKRCNNEKRLFHLYVYGRKKHSYLSCKM